MAVRTGVSPRWDGSADLLSSVVKLEFACVEPFAHATELVPVQFGDSM